MTYVSKFTNTLIVVCVLGFSFFGLATLAEAGITYHMTAGEAVDLKWDSQNVQDCRGANDYYTNVWGSSNPTAQPGTALALLAPKANYGKYSFTSGTLTKPGAYQFRFNCLDDDTTTRFGDITYLRIYPNVPTNLSNNSCNGAGTARTLSWDAIDWAGYSGTRAYVVRVVKPAGESCSGTGGTWTAPNSTSCEVTTTGVSVTFNTTSGTTYTWQAASKAGALISANTNNGAYVAERFTPGASFSCTAAAPTVQLDFKDQ